MQKKQGIFKRYLGLGTMLATIYFGMGNIDKARTLAEESDALNRKIGICLISAIPHLCLEPSIICWGEWNKGEQYLKEALNISLKINNTQQISNSYGFLGWFYYDRGEYVKAKECFEKMSEIEEKTGKKLSKYQIINGLL